MSVKEITAEAIALPLRQRVSLAQTLWQSIEAGLPDTREKTAIHEAVRRDAELSSGKVAGRSHAEVMRAAKKALGCS